MSVPVISDIVNILGQIYNAVISIASAIRGWVDQLIGGLSSFYKPIAEALFGAFVGLGIYIYNGLSSIAGNIKEALIGAFTKISNSFELAFATLGSWLYNAFTFIASGLSRLGEWINSGLKWLSDGFIKLGNDIANAFRGLWDSIVSGAKWIANQLWSALVTLGKYILQGIQWIIQVNLQILGWLVNTILRWINAVSSTLGRWLGGLVSILAQRIYRMIQVDITIIGVWRSVKRIIQAQSWRDYAYGFAGLLLSPIAGTLASSIIQAVFTPKPVESIPIIPALEQLTFTVPSLPAPPEPTPVYSEPVERLRREITITNQPFVAVDVITGYQLNAPQSRTLLIQSTVSAELLEKEARSPVETVVFTAYPSVELKPYTPPVEIAIDIINQCSAEPLLSLSPPPPPPPPPVEIALEVIDNVSVSPQATV